MTPTDIIEVVRDLVQDTDTKVLRYSDELLLRYVRVALSRISMLRPDIFSIVGQVYCDEGFVVQSAPAEAIRIIDVLSVHGGHAVREVNRETLEASVPDWMSAPPGPTLNWMRHVRNPTKFFVYPPAPENQTLLCEYAISPTVYSLTMPIPMLPDAYFGAMVDCVVALVESMDAEGVEAGRAQMFMKSFTDFMTATVGARALTDTKTAGQDRKDII